MRTMYGYRMLARARSKYGRPNYPGRKSNVETICNTKEDMKGKDGNLRKKGDIIRSKERMQDNWNLIKDIMRSNITPVTFETWIEPCNLVSIADDKVVLAVENEFIKEVVDKRFLNGLRDAAGSVLTKRPLEVEVVVQMKEVDIKI